MLCVFFRFMELVRESDPSEYQNVNQYYAFSENFQLFILTTSQSPPEALMAATYPIRVYIP